MSQGHEAAYARSEDWVIEKNKLDWTRQYECEAKGNSSD